jgi:hypothetical protein
MGIRSKIGRRVALFVLGAICILLLLVLGKSGRQPAASSSAHPFPPTQAPATSAAVLASVAGAISGAVRGPDAQPVVGANVCAVDVGSEVLGQPHVSCVESDKSGRYEITLHATGGYRVDAAASGFLPGSANGGRPIFLRWAEKKTGADIVLSGGGAKLVGLVRDATGGPIASATVRVSRFTPPHNTMAVLTNQEGKFVVWAQPGEVTLMAEAVGYAPVGTSHVVPSSDVTLELTPASTVEGVVVSAEDGKPVAGIEVRALPAGSWNGPLHRSGTSDGEGAFSIQGLEPFAYTLIAEGQGWRGQSDRPFEVGLAERQDHVRVTVSHVPSVAGLVRIESDGEPCRQGSATLGPTLPGIVSPYDPPGAKLDTTPSKVPFMLTRIEPDGSVHFPAVPAGKYHVTIQCVDHSLKEGPSTLEVANADLDGIRWTVQSGIRLTLHFVDEADQPLPRARGRFAFPARDGIRGPAFPVEAEADGHYDYPEPLYPGTYTLRAESGYEGEQVPVELREGMARADATLRLLGQGSILVTVRTSDGNPVDDVRVSADAVDPDHATENPAGGPESESKAFPAGAPGRRRTIAGISLGNGRFRLGPLASGRYRVKVSDTVNAPEPRDPSKAIVDVTSRGEVTTDVILDRSGLIRGRILDASQQPVPDVWVSVDCQPLGASGPPKMPNLPGFLQSNRVLSDPEGRFSLGGLARDAVCTLRGEQPGSTIGLRRQARPGDDVVISLPAMGALAGTAATADGQPVEQFMLSIRNEDTGGARNETISAQGGHWTLSSLQPGTLQIKARAASGFAQLRTELAPGATLQDVLLEFASPPATLSN